MSGGQFADDLPSGGRQVIGEAKFILVRRENLVTNFPRAVLEQSGGLFQNLRRVNRKAEKWTAAKVVSR